VEEQSPQLLALDQVTASVRTRPKSTAHSFKHELWKSLVCQGFLICFHLYPSWAAQKEGNRGKDLLLFFFFIIVAYICLFGFFLEISEIIWDNFTSHWKGWTPQIPVRVFALHLRGEWKELSLEQFEFQVHSEELQTWLEIMFGGVVTWAEKKSSWKQELLMMDRASLLCVDFTWCYSLTLKVGRLSLECSLQNELA